MNNSGRWMILMASDDRMNSRQAFAAAYKARVEIALLVKAGFAEYQDVLDRLNRFLDL